jgi:hypothetical protein
MGFFDAGVAATRRAVVLDPLARQSHQSLSEALYATRRYQETVEALAEVIHLDPDFTDSGICRTRALPARRSRTFGTVNSASRWSMTSSAGTRMRKPSLQD